MAGRFCLPMEPGGDPAWERMYEEPMKITLHVQVWAEPPDDDDPAFLCGGVCDANGNSVFFMERELVDGTYTDHDLADYANEVKDGFAEMLYSMDPCHD